MAIKETLSEFQFIDGFPDSRKDTFSYDGLKALYNYLWDVSEYTGEDIEFDPVAICGEYTEYTSIAEYNISYGSECENIDDIQQDTTVIIIDEDIEHFIVADW